MLANKLTQEKVAGVFDARQLLGGGHEKPCVLFFTGDRVVVAVITRQTVWIAIPAAAGMIIGLIGLFLRHLFLFLAGLSAGIGVAFLFGLISFVIGRRSLARLKKLAPHQILAMNKENFEIFYSSIVRIGNKRIERYAGPGYLLPPLPSYSYTVELVTATETCVFILSRKEFDLCNELIREVLPDKVTEISQS